MTKLLLSSLLLSVFCLPLSPLHAADAPPFELKDGDRVVFVGGTFMERESQFGYIETMLTTRFPDRNVTFRNLGYAGDTVGVEARRICSGWAVFGGPDDGFNRLTKLIQEIKPTVVFAAYGMGESFEGEAKLPEFVAKYNRLLDMLTSNSGIPAEQVRVVLIGPNYHMKVEGMPDPAEHNKQLELYSAAIAGLAKARNARFVDLYGMAVHALRNIPPNATVVPTTENGIHPTQEGMSAIAKAIGKSLGFRLDAPSLEIDRQGKVVKADRLVVKQSKQTEKGLTLTVAAETLTPPYWPTRPSGTDALNGILQLVSEPGILKVSDLASGNYRISDGRLSDLRSAENLAQGVACIGDANHPSEKLRQLIVAKNFDYFNYFRPQNDTYILGYRKREQGRNAVEIPQFKPLVELKEKEIAKLRVPQPVTYTLEKQ